MSYRGLQPLLTGLLLCLGTGAHTATFVISTPDDVSSAGECSLRDALYAVTHQEERHACPAGTGNDVIRLAAGTTYFLDEGQLTLGGFVRETPVVDDEDEPVLEDCDQTELEPDETCPPEVTRRSINPVLRMEPLAPEEEDGDASAPVIRAASGERVFWVRQNASLTLDGITLQGCALDDDCVPVQTYEVPGEFVDGEEEGDPQQPLVLPPDGGLLLLDGRLTVRTGASLEAGSARHGGAVFVRANVPVAFQGVSLSNNRATGQGGAIAAALDYGSLISLEGFYLGDNESGAEGGGIALFGGNRAPRLLLANGTLLRNISGSGGAALHVGMLEEDDDADGDDDGNGDDDESNRPTPLLSLANLTVVGNESGDAFDGAGFFIDSLNPLDQLINSVLVANLPADCAGEGLPEGVLASTSSDGVTLAYTVTGFGCPDPGFTAQGGAGGADISVLRGAEGPCVDGVPCEPIIEEEGFSLPGFLPNFFATAPALVDMGSPETSVDFTCHPNDQRGHRREDRCDIGAFEARKARGEPDSFDLVIGRSEIIDVVANDLRDAEIDCHLLADPDTCIIVVRESSRGAEVELHVDDDGYPRLEYHFGPRYDGYDFFSYEVHRDAIIGETLHGREIGAEVALLARPDSGLTRSRNIDDFGGVQPLWLLVLMLGGLLRRGVRPQVHWLAVLTFVPLLAKGADIPVNVMTDALAPPAAAGQCSLREAIRSARDGVPNGTGCADGRTGEDRILLPEGTLTLVAPLLVERGNRIVIEGEGPDKTIIESGGLFRLLSHECGVSLRNLTLRGGGCGGRQRWGNPVIYQPCARQCAP